MCLNALAMHNILRVQYIRFLWSIILYSNKMDMLGIAQPILTCMLTLLLFDHQLYITAPRPQKCSLDIRELFLTLLHRRGEASANGAMWFELTWVYLNKTHLKPVLTSTPQTGFWIFWMVLVSPKHLRPFASRFCTDTFQPSTVLLTLALLDQWPGSTEQENHGDLLSMFDFMFLYGKNHATKNILLSSSVYHLSEFHLPTLGH